MPDIFLTNKDKQELDAKIESKEPKGSWPLPVEKGGTGATSVEDALEKLGLTNFAKIQKVSYVGNGNYGEANPIILPFSFPPRVIIKIGEVEANGEVDHNIANEKWHEMVDMELCPTEYTPGWGFGYLSYIRGKKSPDGKTLYFYAYKEPGSYQNNDSGVTYSYIGLS